MTDPLGRRRLLQSLGVAGVAALAGCLGDSGNSSTPTATGTSTDTATLSETETPTTTEETPTETEESTTEKEWGGVVKALQPTSDSFVQDSLILEEEGEEVSVPDYREQHDRHLEHVKNKEYAMDIDWDALLNRIENNEQIWEYMGTMRITNPENDKPINYEEFNSSESAIQAFDWVHPVPITFFMYDFEGIRQPLFEMFEEEEDNGIDWWGDLDRKWMTTIDDSDWLAPLFEEATNMSDGLEDHQALFFTVDAWEENPEGSYGEGVSKPDDGHTYTMNIGFDRGNNEFFLSDNSWGPNYNDEQFKNFIRFLNEYEFGVENTNPHTLSNSFFDGKFVDSEDNARQFHFRPYSFVGAGEGWRDLEQEWEEFKQANEDNLEHLNRNRSEEDKVSWDDIKLKMDEHGMYSFDEMITESKAHNDYFFGMARKDGVDQFPDLSQGDVNEMRTQMVRDFVASRRPEEKSHYIGEDAGVIATQAYGHSFVDTIRQPDQHFEDGEQTLEEVLTQSEVIDQCAEEDGYHVIAGKMYDDPTVIELEGDNAEEIFEQVRTGEYASIEDVAQDYEIDGLEATAA